MGQDLSVGMLGMAAPFGQVVGFCVVLRGGQVGGWVSPEVSGRCQPHGRGITQDLAPVSVPCERVAARSVVASAVADGTAQMKQ